MKYVYSTPNLDYQGESDLSVVEYDNGKLTLRCNEGSRTYEVTGTPKNLAKVREALTVDGEEQPIDPDNPEVVLEVLGLELR